jgi:hypothetical protein
MCGNRCNCQRPASSVGKLTHLFNKRGCAFPNRGGAPFSTAENHHLAKLVEKSRPAGSNVSLGAFIHE